MELTIRYVDKIQSERLALAIGRIACKILGAFRSGFLKKVSVAGYSLADRISRIAVSWGYAEAMGWRRDVGFVRFLGVNAVNAGIGWS